MNADAAQMNVNQGRVSLVPKAPWRETLAIVWGTFICATSAFICVSKAFCSKERLCRLFGKRDAGDLGFLQQLPEVAVGGAVVELAGVLDRSPLGALRGEQDRGGVADFSQVGLHRVDDRLDLHRMDAPHPQETEIVARAPRVAEHVVRIL